MAVKIPPEAAQAVLGLVKQAIARKLDGRGSSAFQSVLAGLGDLLPAREQGELKTYLTGARGEIQEAHDDFHAAGRPRADHGGSDRRCPGGDPG